MPLTELEIKNARPKEKAYRLPDASGLYLDVRPTGKRVWRVKYKMMGKENTLTLGEYPLVTLRQAREKRDEARRLIINGVDPAVRRDMERLESDMPTFGDIALEYMAKKQKESTSAKARYALEMRMRKYILPFLGNMPPDGITPPQILNVLRRLEGRGTLETAHRVHQIIGQVFRYGVATGRAARDSSADLRGALGSVPEGHFASITDAQKLGGLLRAIGGYTGSVAVRTALQLQAYVFVRPGELRHAEWAELYLGGDKKEWRIPAEKMKMKRPHIVPLADQAVLLLDKMRNISGHGRYIFPSARTRSGSRPLSDNAFVAALRSMGYSGEEMTAHGFRHTASTLLNESGLWSGDAIERQLAHVDRNRIRAVYNAAEYLPERRRMMQWYADYLDGLRG
ncbi:MAG: integrase arm-type DNA-binding domain-containing protein [Synergistaceae bacterium]|jgi:integrase|nr:integrase arm-type DNA-binding domain-containing protein [Synergistaceae bacterium]